MRKISLIFVSILLVGCTATGPDATPVAAPTFNDTVSVTGIPLASRQTPIVKPTPTYKVSRTIKPVPKPTKTKTTQLETPKPSVSPTVTKTKSQAPKPVEKTTQAKPTPTKTVTPSKTPTIKATTTATPSPTKTTRSLPSPTKTASVASSTTVWDKIAECESGGDWTINTGNGFYGGLQFTLSSWQAMGGTGYPHQASKSEQIMRAEKLQDAQGWGAWPVCSIKAGVR